MMRLRERELITAELAKRTDVPGPMGGRPEVFSEEKTAFRASLLFEDGGLETTPRGLVSGEKIRLLAPAGLDVQAGDGVYVEGRLYAVLSVKKWTAHRELVCGARS